MPEGLLEFILQLLHKALNFSKLLPIPMKLAAAASFLPPLFVAAQVIWKSVQGFGAERRKKVLREKILRLENFLRLSPDAELPEEQALATYDARREKAEAIGQLARLASAGAELAGAMPEPLPQRAGLQRTLLLYSPKRRGLWILHVLFYFFAIEVLALTLVFLMKLIGGYLGIAAGMMPALLLFTVPALIFWGLAADLERSEMRSRNPLETWLLLYAPERRERWALHVLFYVSLVAFVAALAAIPGAIRGNTVAGVVIQAVLWFLLAVLFRRSAMLPSREERELSLLDRSLLLYAPRNHWAWLLHVLFWLEVGTGFTLLVFMGQAVLGGASVTAKDVEQFMYILVLMFVFWGWASNLEEGRPEPPSLARRLFLLYLPDRKFLWVLHGLFYLIVLMAVSGLGDVATGRLVVQEVSTTTGQVILKTPVEGFAPILYMFLVAVLSRTLAVGLEPWSDGMPSWITWLWLGRQPQPWLRRSAFLWCAFVFYASVGLWPLLVLESIDDLRTHQIKSVFLILLPTIAVGLISRWGARYLQSAAFQEQVS